MAGTGLPTGGGGRPVLTEPSPLVPTDDGAAQSWGQTAAAADRMTDRFAALAQHMEQAQRVAFRADLEDRASRDLLAAYAKNPDNPEGFREAARGIRDGILGGIPLEHADDARRILNKLEFQYESRATTAYIAKTQQQSADRIDTRMNSLLSEGMSFAGARDMQGFERSYTDFASFADEKARLGMWSPEHAEEAKNRFQVQGRVEAIVGHVRQRFTEVGAEAAYTEVERQLANPELRLHPVDQEKYLGRATTEVNRLQSFRQADLTIIRGEAAELKKRADVGKLSRDDTVNMVGKLTALGDRKGAQEMAQIYENQEVTAFVAGLPEAESERYIQAQKSAPARPLADRIIGVESGGRADAKNPNSSATGAGQFIESTWLDQVKRNAPEVAAGKSDAEILALRSDPALSRRMVETYADENRAEMAARGLPTNDAAVYLAHFLGPTGAAKVLGADPSTPVDQLVGGDAVAANKSILGGKTAGDVIGWATRKMGTGSTNVDLIKSLDSLQTRKREGLRNDPLGWNYGLLDAPPIPDIDWTRPDSIIAGLGEQTRFALATEARFRLGPVAPLTRGQMDELQGAYDRADSAGRARLVGALARALPERQLAATMEKVGADRPVMAEAARIYQRNPDLATSLIEGETLMRDEKYRPKETDVQRAYEEKVGTAFGMNGRARGDTLAAVKARYVSLRSRVGKYGPEFDQDTFDQAVSDVVGNIVEWRGRKLIAPRPEVSNYDFRRGMDAITDADLVALSDNVRPARVAGTSAVNIPAMWVGTETDPKRVTAEDFKRFGVLHPIQDGRYLVEIGGGFARGVDNEPYTLNLTRMKIPARPDILGPAGNAPEAYTSGGAAAAFNPTVDRSMR